MSITRSASGRDRTWDDNWDKWDGSDNGWIEVGQGSDDSQGFAGIERAPGLVHQLLNAFAQGLLVNGPAISGPPVDTHQLPNPLDQGPVNDPALLAVDAHHLLNSFFLDGGDPAISGPPVDAHQLLNVLDQGPVNDPVFAGQSPDVHELPNNPSHDRDDLPDGASDEDEDHGADTDEVGDAGHDRQGMLGEEHSSRQDPSDGHHDGASDEDEDHGADTDEVGDAGHDRQGMLGEEHSSRQDPSDGHHAGAPDEDEDHGADTDEVGDAGHDRQGMLGEEHSSRQDPSDGHHDISGTEIASSDSADTFVWSDTFSQGDGANHVSADEEHWPQMDAFSEASVLDGGTDLHCDDNMPDTT